MLALGLWLALVPRALADGDPASDVLAGQPYFLETDAGFSNAEQQKLGGVIAAAAKAGFPVRVAVIATRSDLGTISKLWREPEPYAEFLGLELSGIVPGSRILVVMPDGLGFYPASAITPAERAVAGRPAFVGPVHGNLSTRAIAAVAQLAAADGHPIPSAVATPSLPARHTAGGWGVVSVAVFILGLAAIAAAWTASLRARPLSARSRPGTAGAPASAPPPA